MKRTNLVLDADKLNEAVAILGVKTYSAAVNRALDDAINLAKIRGISNYFNSGAWSGDLAIMRDDTGTRLSQKSNTRPAKSKRKSNKSKKKIQ